MSDPKEHQHGLAHDWTRLIGRRGFVAGGSALMLSTPSLAQTVCVPDPHETPGPFSADGSNRKGNTVLNVLTKQGVVREDIRTSFGSMKGTAAGVPLDLEIECVDVNQSCAGIPNLAVYIWHCDAPARYSLYDLPEQNYLRGVQFADLDGKLKFRTIFPGCYPGRWPHIHFEVFRDLNDQSSIRDSLLVSQFALDRASSEAIYQMEAYGSSAKNLAPLSLDRDIVFRDNSPSELTMQMVSLQQADSKLVGTVRIGLVL